MKRKNKIILGISTIIIIIGIGVCGGYFFLEGLCKNNIIQEVPSPNNKYKAVIYERNCGATTGFSTQVSIFKTSKHTPKGYGNIFIADTDHGKAPSGPGGGPQVNILWIENNKIVLKHHKNARVFLAKTQYKDIEIHYESIK